MCELFCLSSHFPTVATFSLAAFAQHGGKNGSAIDGWGIALYDRRDLRLYKEPEPASDSAWLDFIEGHGLASRILLSHIRHATRGAVSYANTQPFTRELGGRMHVFAHNGQLDKIETRLAGGWERFLPLGETDSEIAFCILLERLSALWRDGSTPPIEKRISVVARFAEALRALGPANFLYADGDAVFAHAHRRLQADGTISSPGLWHLHRACAIDTDALPQAGVTIEPVSDGQRITLLASVPLTDEAWQPLAEGEVVVLQDGGPVAYPAA